MTPTHYFVYGTLRPGGKYWRNIDACIESYEPAYVDGFVMYHLPDGYPAIEVGAGQIFGDILTVKAGFEESAREMMDEIECYEADNDNSLYRRVTTRANLLRRRGLAMTASIYVFGSSRGTYLREVGVRVESGDWREFMAMREDRDGLE